MSEYEGKWPGHTVEWVDGLKVTRIFVYRRRGRPPQMYLSIIWNGVGHTVRVGSRVGDIWRA